MCVCVFGVCMCVCVCVCVCPANPQVQELVQVHELVEQMVDGERGRVLGCGDNPELDSE